MKLSFFAKRFLQVFHNPPTDGGGGGGEVTPPSSATPGEPSLVDQVFSLAGGILPSPTPTSAAPETDPTEVVTPPAPTSGDAGNEDWIAKLPPEVQADVRARVARIEGERDAFKTLNPKPAEGAKSDGKAKATLPPVVNPLAALTTPEQLAEVEQRAEGLREWAWLNPGGGVLPGPDGTEIQVSEEQARRMFLQQDAILRKHLPARHAQLAQQGQREAKQRQTLEDAKTVYPWLGKQDSPEYAVYTNLLNAMPELQAKFGDAPLFVADMVAGFMARQAALKAKGTTPGNGLPLTPPAPTKPPVVPRGGHAGGSGAPAPRSHEDSISRLAATGGSKEGLEAFFTELYGAQS